jgi:hypothetical protein
MLWIVILLIVNFVISWFNASNVGRIWSEAKQIGGGTRVLAVAGYIMAIAGFTMVYSILIGYFIAYAGPASGYMTARDAADLAQLVSDMSYILVILPIIPAGIIITVNSLITFWKHKSLRTGGIAAWNTFASMSNVISASRNVPSAFGRIMSSVKNSRDNSGIVRLAIAIVLLAVLGGYFTASAIMKRADQKYDLFAAVGKRKTGYEL